MEAVSLKSSGSPSHSNSDHALKADHGRRAVATPQDVEVLARQILGRCEAHVREQRSPH
jgi:hypothetical protein